MGSDGWKSEVDGWKSGVDGYLECLHEENLNEPNIAIYHVNACSGDSATRESVLPRLDIQSGVDRPRSPIAPLCIVVPVSAVSRGRPRDLGPGLSQYFPSVSRCSGITVISVLHECAPKIRREAFATTETSLGKPCRVPKGPFPGALCSSVDRAPGAPSEKVSVRDRERPDSTRMPPERAQTSLVTLALRGIFKVPYWAPFGISLIR
ncbi:hypothetical protein CRG98_001958 [Punica granatum]|uniref:Uncharacterized protein n=1 Tax=Punica granatum TaxID=22663 RepID=A0A2I0LAD4_PUNGR|nr:hypothetical protein CRG98_001958 [Punica granatum]